MEKGEEYVVLYPFRDLLDKSVRFPSGRIYATGDIYRNGKASPERIRELSGTGNKIGRSLIAPKNLASEVDEHLPYDSVTKADIGALLDEKGIEYNKRDAKQVLYDLLLGSE